MFYSDFTCSHCRNAKYRRNADRDIRELEKEVMAGQADPGRLYSLKARAGELVCHKCENPFAMICQYQEPCDQVICSDCAFVCECSKTLCSKHKDFNERGGFLTCQICNKIGCWPGTRDEVLFDDESSIECWLIVCPEHTVTCLCGQPVCPSCNGGDHICQELIDYAGGLR
jgi:hypothetical protein